MGGREGAIIWLRGGLLHTEVTRTGEKVALTGDLGEGRCHGRGKKKDNKNTMSLRKKEKIIKQRWGKASAGSYFVGKIGKKEQKGFIHSHIQQLSCVSERLKRIENPQKNYQMGISRRLCVWKKRWKEALNCGEEKRSVRMRSPPASERVERRHRRSQTLCYVRPDADALTE